MMASIKIIYISLSGNTKHFLEKLQAYANQANQRDMANPLIELKEVRPGDQPVAEESPFIAFVPTYLTGGNGLDNGYTEMGTTSLRHYIASFNNADCCLGVVGSGNKNFNAQYCLTARQYADEFNVPFLDNYELRGTQEDIKRIYGSLKMATMVNVLAS